MNRNLQFERSRATFDPERLTHLLDSGKDRTERRRHLEQVIERDPTGVFHNADNNYLHRTDRHVRSLAKHVRMIELARMLGIGNECGGEITQSRDFFLLVQAVADDLPTSLHWVMFVPNLRSLADDEQLKQWLPLCRDWRMIGCYAQTVKYMEVLELGHGSNVRALETTATFVPPCSTHVDGAWRIHSPSLTSAKFWPGTLGRTANHAVVIARLIDGLGVDRGIHNFLVPLRSIKDHTLLKGVSTGDIGPKIGYNVMDNGYARFDQVLIPRRNMLMRFASVDKRGKYTKLSKKNKSESNDDAAEKIAYITMMQVRAYIVNEAGKNLAMACCISIRYSAVRQQGYNASDDNKTERPILDYTQQQHRLFPLLAASYCFFFTGRQLLQRLQEMEHRLVASSSSSSSSSSVSKAIVTDIHASSSALKSFCTMVTADGIEDCRKACGGHGYLACSGLPELFTTYLQNPTVEGDNHMLPQQVVKVLLKVLQAVVVATKQTDDVALNSFRDCDSCRLIPSLVAILAPQKQQQPRCAAQSAAEMANNLDDVLVPAFGHRAARLLIQVGAQLETAQKQHGKSFPEAWNDALVLMARVSRAYAQLLLLGNFVDGIRNEEAATMKQGGSDCSAIGVAEISVLRDLARLFALYWMERELGDFVEDGYVSPHQANWIHDGVLELLRVVRPNAVALVDARDFSDFRLKSALGRYDGNVYPAVMEAARKDPLNHTDPGPGVEHIKRLVVDGVGRYTGTASRL